MPDKPQLLFVDDEPNFLRLVEVFFDWGGIAKVHATSDPSEACRIAGEINPDYVFVDTVMPGIDGDHLARDLKEQAGSSAKLVSLSGLARNASWADVSLTKTGEVLETIRELIKS
jgi:CheY-like chemotaxis protein